MKTKLLFMTLIIMISCNNKKYKIDHFENKIKIAENNISHFKETDWDELNMIMIELEKDLEIDKNSYSADEIKKINNLKGKYKALQVKKQILKTKEVYDEVKDQIEGFVEGFKSDTLNK